MRLLDFLLISGSFVAAQAPEAPKMVRVEGHVLTLAGVAIPKATITLQAPGVPAVPAVSTDKDGKFVFEEVPPGRYTTLSAQKAGFATQRYGARTSSALGTPLTLTAGTVVRDLLIRMTQQGVISGHITDQDGDPVAGALVNILRDAYTRGRRLFSSTAANTTNDQGDFRIANLAPGRYYVVAQARRMTLSSQSHAASQEVDVTTYYPNGLDEASAKPLDLSAGGELRGIDIRLLKRRVYSFRGKMLDRLTNASPAGLPVGLVRADSGGLTNLSKTRPDGTFEFSGLAAGRYVVQTMPGNLTGPDGQSVPSNYSARMEVTITDASLDGVVLALAPGFEVNGTVKLEDGDLKDLVSSNAAPAAAGTVVSTDLALAIALGRASAGRMTILLAQWFGTDFAPGPASSAVSQEDGGFRLQGVGPNIYLMTVSGLPEGVYMKSVKFGEHDVTRTPLDLTSGGGTMHILLSSRAADISGTAHDGKGDPISRAIITLWPETPNLGSTTAVTHGDPALT